MLELKEDFGWFACFIKEWLVYISEPFYFLKKGYLFFMILFNSPCLKLKVSSPVGFWYNIGINKSATNKNNV